MPLTRAGAGGRALLNDACHENLYLLAVHVVTSVQRHVVGKVLLDTSAVRDCEKLNFP